VDTGLGKSDAQLFESAPNQYAGACSFRKTAYTFAEHALENGLLRCARNDGNMIEHRPDGL
jgi:hypothetical protein